MTRKSLWRSALAASSGFQLVELLVLLGVAAILSAIGFPLYLSYHRAQETEGAARTIVASLHQARQLAIMRGITYTVETQTNPNNRMRFTCTAGPLCPTPVFVGPGTDGSGWRRLENSSRITQGPTITFTSLGAATVAPGGTPFRVQNSTATGTLDVCVFPSGRIRVQAQGAACP